MIGPASSARWVASTASRLVARIDPEVEPPLPRAVISTCGVSCPTWICTSRTPSGKKIVTVEGLGTPERPHPLQRAFIAEQACQCGYCVSGILISAAALLKRNPNPSEVEVRAALDRNLCRCGAHNRIVRAVQRAAKEAI